MPGENTTIEDLIKKEERKLGLFDNQTYEQQVEILRKAQEEGKLKSNSGFIHEY
ncbi:MAG: hypothetical protein ACD_46C00270G0001 [uncultured bacterium]|nr:MAG: hypothetical protein ACD_46C00270G0001 [uncultured bacterium]